MKNIGHQPPWVLWVEMKLYFSFFHFFFTVMEFMTCVSFGHSCFHVVSTCRYDCSCLFLCCCCIIHVSLVSYIQTCLNSFCFEFTYTYYVFKNILLVACTQSSILCQSCILFYLLQSCTIYLIKLQYLCKSIWMVYFYFKKKKLSFFWLPAQLMIS